MAELKIQNFNHLKIHSQYSICEGAIKIDDLKDLSKESKIKAKSSNVCKKNAYNWDKPKLHQLCFSRDVYIFPKTFVEKRKQNKSNKCNAMHDEWESFLKLFFKF